MRIACVGKGGSGKTTVSSTLFKYLSIQNKTVLAIDADINQHFGSAIGLESDEIDSMVELGNDLPRLKQILLSENETLTESSKMVKTTLPLKGSHLVEINKSDAVMDVYAKQVSSTSYLMRVGGFHESDMGTKCFHSKTGGAELVLNHLMDKKDEYVLVDMTAGADAFASGLFTRFDLTLIVVEPTLKSLSVYKQYKEYAKDYGVNICVIGNKVEDEDDLEFLQENCGDDLLGCLTRSKWVKKTERGQQPDILSFEEENLAVLDTLIAKLEQMNRDWADYWKWGIHFHNKNAESWANAAVGCDVREFVDTDYLSTLTA